MPDHERLQAKGKDISDAKANNDNGIANLVALLDRYRQLINRNPLQLPQVHVPEGWIRDMLFDDMQTGLASLVLRNQPKVGAASATRIESLHDWREVIAAKETALSRAGHEAAMPQMPAEILELIDANLTSKADKVAFRLSARRLLVTLSSVILNPQGSEMDDLRMRTILGRDSFAIICRLELKNSLHIQSDLHEELNLHNPMTVAGTSVASSVIRHPTLFPAWHNDEDSHQDTARTRPLLKDESEWMDLQESPSTKLYACSSCETAHPASSFKSHELRNSPEVRICFEEFPVRLCAHIIIRHRDICRILAIIEWTKMRLLPEIYCHAHGTNCMGSANVRLLFLPGRGISYQNTFSTFVLPGIWTMGRAAKEIWNFIRFGPVCEHISEVELYTIWRWINYDNNHAAGPPWRRFCQVEQCSSYVEVSVHPPDPFGEVALSRHNVEFRIQTIWQWPAMQSVPRGEWADVIEQTSFVHRRGGIWGTTPGTLRSLRRRA